MGRIKTLPRRTFLRGMGGVALALPALEIMSPSSTARAGGGPTPRFMTSFVGTSTGRTYWPNDECCGTTYPGDRITPDSDGAGYDLKQSLLPVGAAAWQYTNGFGGDQAGLDVQDQLTVVSGLTIPWGTGADIPPAGRTIGFHYTTITPQISGTICAERSAAPTGPTIDQIVADAVGGGPALAYRVEAKSAGGNDSAMSWKRDGSGVRRVDPVVNPRLAWESLFTGFIPPDPAEAKAVAFELAQRRSVLDLVGDNTQRLLARLGRADTLRMEQHLAELRALEKRAQELTPPNSPQCEMLADPGTDWPVTPDDGWSNEELRAEVLCDLIHMAFVCELTSAASLMFGQWKCYLKMGPAIGWDADLHGYSHYGGSQTGIGPLSDAIAWHIKHFARLVRKCVDTPDIDGAPLIDHTVLTMVFEGGWGFDPEGGADSTHSTENMIVLVAGGGGLGLSPGRHIRGAGAHPGAVLLGAAQACGVDEALGDITEGFSGL